MDEKDIIAKNIIYYRKKMNLSQLELSEKLNYSNKNISKWEKGETTPSIFTLKRLAEIFEISLDELVGSLASEKETAIESKKPQKLKSSKTKMKLSAKILFLLMANAILIVLSCVAIYVLSLLGVTAFNKWLTLLYVIPLSSLSVFIFIACVKKRADIISISISGWSFALCIYLTLKNISAIGYVFFLMGGLQILTLTIMLIINGYVKNKEKERKTKSE